MQNQKRVSVKDIAAKLNVSLSTVHKALTGKPGIGEAKRREIIKAAEEMGYTVNAAAQALSRKSINIGVIIPSRWQEYFMDLKRGIDSQLSALGELNVNGIYYTIPLIYPSSDEHLFNANEILKWIDDNKIDALLYCASHYALNECASDILSGINTPTFWVGGGTDIPFTVSNITLDADLTGKLAADFLLCCSYSHPNAAVFTGSMKTIVHKAKTEAFCKRITENGGKILEVVETEDDPDKAYSKMKELYSKYPDVNAVYVSTSTSEPICRFIEEFVPKNKISLLGTDIFDSLSEYIKRDIMKATISQNQEEVGRLAASYAYEYINKTHSYGHADWKPEHVLLVDPTLLLKANIE